MVTINVLIYDETNIQLTQICNSITKLPINFKYNSVHSVFFFEYFKNPFVTVFSYFIYNLINIIVTNLSTIYIDKGLNPVVTSVSYRPWPYNVHCHFLSLHFADHILYNLATKQVVNAKVLKFDEAVLLNEISN